MTATAQSSPATSTPIEIVKSANDGVVSQFRPALANTCKERLVAFVRLASAGDAARAKKFLGTQGFTLGTELPGALVVRGTRAQFHSTFGAKIERVPAVSVAGAVYSGVDAPWVIVAHDKASPKFPAGIAGVSLTTVLEPAAISKDDDGSHQLNVPGDILDPLGVPPVHEAGYQGQGATAVLIDEGFPWKDHEAFRGYTLETTQHPFDLGDPADGPTGHGIFTASNFLAVAPKARLIGYRHGGQGLPALADAIQRDVGGGKAADVIICPWTLFPDYPTDGPHWRQGEQGGQWRRGNTQWTRELAEIAPQVNELRGLLQLAEKRGILVLFAAGNRFPKTTIDHFQIPTWPGYYFSHSFTASAPGAVAVGGVYVDKSGDLWPCGMTSHFQSRRFGHSVESCVPEVCGLSGIAPGGRYLRVPSVRSGTTRLTSGSSLSVAQAGGIVALIKCKFPTLTPAEVRVRLRRARVVVNDAGVIFPTLSHREATGFGLVNAMLATT